MTWGSSATNEQRSVDDCGTVVAGWKRSDHGRSWRQRSRCVRSTSSNGAVGLLSMRWLKRGLWLTAWVVWAWLGVGLHRELPRQAGRLVHRLPFEGGEVPLGWIEGTSKAVSIRYNPAAEKTSVRRWDVATGTLEQEISGPWFDGGPFAFILSPRKRFMACGCFARTTGL